MKSTIQFFVLLVTVCGLVLFFPILAAAQPPPPFLAPPDQAPIDGGLGLLAAAGGAYAWKKLRRKDG